MGIDCYCRDDRLRPARYAIESDDIAAIHPTMRSSKGSSGFVVVRSAFCDEAIAHFATDKIKIATLLRASQ